MTVESTSTLPPIRKKIFRNFAILILLYIALGSILMFSVLLATKMTPRMIHVNYDSIAAAAQMRKAWYALQEPSKQKKAANYINEFEKAITFAEGNITEPGENVAVRDIRTLWNNSKSKIGTISEIDRDKMSGYLDALVTLNEKSMFRIAQESIEINHRVFLVSLIVFLITVILGFTISDSLSNKLAQPIKELAERLRARANPERMFTLPEPNSLEMRILNHELMGLWNTVVERRKLNLEKLSQQSIKLEAVLTSVEDAILVFNNEERIIHANEGMLTLLALKTTEVLEQKWTDLSTQNNNYLKLRDIIGRPIPRENAFEFDINGKKRVFAIRERKLIGKDVIRGKIGTLYLLHDITELRHRERLKAEFIGVLAHEIKTPLQSLGTAAEILETRTSGMSDESRGLVDTMLEDISRIRAVANDFMQVSVTDLHSLKLRIEKVPLSDLLQEWIKPFRILARDKNVKIEFVKEGSPVILANVDIVKFPWAISNLLSNAIRVSPESGKVKVYITDREQSAVHVKIIDEGPGIPEEIQKRMFEPYFQGEKVNSGKASGFLGLGLTIAKEVVEAHEGQIEYFNNKPRGSLFRISLPQV